MDLSESVSDDETPLEGNDVAVVDVDEREPDEEIREVIIDEEEQDVQKKRGPTATHPVWAHYRWINAESNQCRYCNHTIKRRHGSTSAMRHLKVCLKFRRQN